MEVRHRRGDRWVRLGAGAGRQRRARHRRPDPDGRGAARDRAGSAQPRAHLAESGEAGAGRLPPDLRHQRHRRGALGHRRARRSGSRSGSCSAGTVSRCRPTHPRRTCRPSRTISARSRRSAVAGIWRTRSTPSGRANEDIARLPGRARGGRAGLPADARSRRRLHPRRGDAGRAGHRAAGLRLVRGAAARLRLRRLRRAVARAGHPRPGRGGGARARQPLGRVHPARRGRSSPLGCVLEGRHHGGHQDGPSGAGVQHAAGDPPRGQPDHELGQPARLAAPSPTATGSRCWCQRTPTISG